MSDSELEQLIDRAGRDKVFAYAQAAGWSIANSPPKWVWAQIAGEIIRENAKKEPWPTF